MFVDARDLPLTTDSAEAARLFDQAMQELLDFRATLPETAQAMLAEHPRFVMGNVLCGLLQRLGGNDALLPRAKAFLEVAQEHAPQATPREQQHVLGLAAWLAGDLPLALQAYQVLLRETPQDLLAMKMLQYLQFWGGDSTGMRDTVKLLVKSLDPGLPGYGYVLGALAFGLEECGEYAAAEKAGREAVARNPDDLWAVHAVAHVLEMQGRLQEGIAWLDGQQQHWSGRNAFVHHLWWHQALYWFELERWPELLRLYDTHIWPASTDFYQDMHNAASLLWRLMLQRVEVGPRWDALADVASQRRWDFALPFTTVHYVMALLGAGRTQALSEQLRAIRDYAGSHHTGYAAPLGGVALPVCEGLVAFHEGVYNRAAERLMKSYGRLHQLGASHAQRDVLVLTLVEASLRGRYPALARDLLEERAHARPNSPNTWHRYARALELCRDGAGAQTALSRAERLLQPASG